MKKPDEETLKAIISFESRPDGMVVFRWLQESLDSAEKLLYENTVFNAGRVAEIADIVRTFMEARQRLEDIRKGR